MPNEQKRSEEPTIRLGVSTCLLGEEVRYNGGHKLDRFLVNTLGPFVEWVPVCPEFEIGLGVPRESLRLVGDPEAPRLIAPKSGQDHTERMQTWARERLEELTAVKLHGFIFKKDSPSSGLFRVRVYDDEGMPRRVGTGIFPREVMKRSDSLCSRWRRRAACTTCACERTLSSGFSSFIGGRTCWKKIQRLGDWSDFILLTS